MISASGEEAETFVTKESTLDFILLLALVIFAVVKMDHDFVCNSFNFSELPSFCINVCFYNFNFVLPGYQRLSDVGFHFELCEATI